MKFRISVGLNVLLLTAVGVLAYRQSSKEVEYYYYRKMVGVVCRGAAEKMQKGDIDSAKAALMGMPSDPNFTDILSSGRKLGVIQ